jgi:hypothetical protein
LNVSVSIPEQTSGGDETPGVSEVLSDLTPDNYWIPGADYAADGHHHNPRGVYRKLPLPEETRKVFGKATTGSLPFYKWHEYDELHRMYNDAVEELMSRFMKEQGGTNDARPCACGAESNCGVERAADTGLSLNAPAHGKALPTAQRRPGK